MKVNLIKPSENKIYDISDAYESVSWSGSALSAGRNVEIAYILSLIHISEPTRPY